MNLKSYLLSATLKDSAILLTASGISTFFNIFILLFLTKSLTLVEFGLFVTGLTFIQIVTDVFELGINSATLNLSSDKSKSFDSLIGSALFLKVIIGLSVGLIVYIFSRQISEIIFQNRAMIPYIKYSAFGIGFAIIIAWFQAFMQAKQRFLSVAYLISASNVFRLILLIILIGMVKSRSVNIYLAFQFTLGLIILTFCFTHITSFRFIKEMPIFNKKEITKILKYGLPIGISFAIAAIYTKLDQIMILNLANSTEAGIYGLASRITIPIILAVSSFSSAIIPRFVSIDDTKFNIYFKKSLLVSGVMAVGILVLIIFLPWIIPHFFGINYQPSIIPAQILGLGMIFFVLSSTFYNLIIYRIKDTNFPLIISAISLILIIFLLSILIPIYFSVGAALSVLIVYLLQLILGIVYYIRISKMTRFN